ncbi:MAG: DUF3606 domain-containing protein [Flavisolibacter sp.]
MADNKDLRDGRDSSRVAGNEDYELQHVAEKMGVTIDEVRRAIEAVGNNREKVEAYLEKISRA